MNMFATPLNELLRGDSLGSRKVSLEARFCVEVWRAVSIIDFWDTDSMAVPMQSVKDNSVGTADYSEVLNF